MSWAEEQDWFGLEDLALEAEEQREDAKSKIEQGIWFQRGGVPISLKQMTYRHICNCINMIENGRLCRKWALPYLKAEQKRRLENGSNQ